MIKESRFLYLILSNEFIPQTRKHWYKNYNIEALYLRIRNNTKSGGNCVNIEGHIFSVTYLTYNHKYSIYTWNDEPFSRTWKTFARSSAYYMKKTKMFYYSIDWPMIIYLLSF